jgi:hypothetical protein
VAPQVAAVEETERDFVDEIVEESAAFDPAFPTLLASAERVRVRAHSKS